MKKAQTVLEYAMLIFIVIAALVAMGLYIQRGINAKLKVTEIQINTSSQAGMCGNGVCEPQNGETQVTCQKDCAVCGDSICSAPVETCLNCAKDCGPCPVCDYDGYCEPEQGENKDNCPYDCEYPCDVKCYPYSKHLFRCESPCCKKCDWCDPDAVPPCKV
jgi:hypothetical protein